MRIVYPLEPPDKTRDFVAIRDAALAGGDPNLARSMQAELDRLGYREPAVESTALRMPERAVPEKPRRGRPPRPRCEHDMIVGRCPECDGDDLAA